MTAIAALLGLGGLALATGLFIYYGLDSVLAALAAGGIGIVWASLFHVVPMVIHARAWQILLPGSSPPPLSFILWVNWIREGMNGLLPLARVAGDVVAVRMLIKRGVRSTPAMMSMVVDMTLTIVMQYFFTVVGVVLLLHYAGSSDTVEHIVIGLLAGLPIMGLMLMAHRFGLFGLLARLVHALVGHRWPKLTASTARLDRAVRTSYRRQGRIFRSCAWQFVGWVAGTGEIWLALYFLGHPVSVWDAFILESMAQAVASAAFMVPAAIGVQEGAFLVVGTMLGLSPEVALALALVRRARDLIIFVPALVAWQVAESRHLLARI